MKVAPTFEIRIAVIGPVSAGKSTLINAMLVGKYNEVSLRRTTAGVNFFRLNPGGGDRTPTEDKTSDTTSETASPSSPDWSLVADKVDHEDVILKQISKDNKSLREQDKVQEKTFDIEGVDLFETRKDTKLVIVDVPGINEAESSSKYRDYIEAKWSTFDCVILVMDARSGVNTEEQVDLLYFVKQNMEEKKNMPSLILFNKVDELDYQEEKDITEEARLKIFDVFEIGNSNEFVIDTVSLPQMKDKEIKRLKNRSAEGRYFPIFLPISARNGYVFRLAPVVDEARFKTLERDLVEVLGKEQIGLRKWNRLSGEEKYKEAYEAISDPDVYEEGLRSSSFELFLSVLGHCIAGEQTQKTLIERQIGLQMELVEAKQGLVQKVQELHEKMLTLGMDDTKNLQGAFWTAFETMEHDMFCGTGTEILDEGPLNELILYHELALNSGWSTEALLAVERVRLHLNRFVDACLDGICTDKLPIACLSQMLAMTGNPHFEDHFGELRTIIETSYTTAVVAKSLRTYCCNCQQAVEESHYTIVGTTGKSCYSRKGADCPIPGCHGQLRWGDHSACLDDDSSRYKKYKCFKCRRFFQPTSQVTRPKGMDFCCRFIDGKWTRGLLGLRLFTNVPPSNKCHYGHLFWMFCEWMERLPKSAQPLPLPALLDDSKQETEGTSGKAESVIQSNAKADQEHDAMDHAFPFQDDGGDY